MAMRFDPIINWGHILIASTMVVGSIGAYGVLDKRTAVLEAARVTQEITDRRQDEQVADMKRTNREDFREINNKLEKLLMFAQTQPPQQINYRQR
jgi:hypothetical protein